MRFNPVRIDEAWAKVVYVVAVWAIIWVPSWFVPGEPAVAQAFSAVAIAWDTAAVVVAARIFRSREEDVVAPRPWWRLTADRRLAIVLGCLCLSMTLAWVVAIIGGGYALDLYSTSSTLFFAWLGAWYLYCARRLPRAPRREKPFRPLKPFREI